MGRLRAVIAILLASLFFVSIAPTADAVPAVPYCPGSVSPVAPSTGVPAIIDPALCEQVSGRVFPEASALSTEGLQLPALDYVSYFEFQAGLQYLEAGYPDYITVHEVAQSYGLCPQPVASTPVSPGMCPTARDQFPIYILEITNEKSPMPLDERQSLLFMLSIHGNEKGGREGGFRVLEDLVKGIGFAAETVQNGAGLPVPITKPTGGTVQTYYDYLDFTRVFLLFPNVDGWAHDELPYALTEAGMCGTLYCRTNGNQTDLNRQAPTMGWQQVNAANGRLAVNEPEAIGYYNWMLTNDIDWAYAIDIHGMLMHQNFVAIMLPAASMTPQEMQRSVRLAETLKERLNGNDHFAAYDTLFGTLETAEDLAAPVLDIVGGTADDACAQFDCPLPGSALSGSGRPSETFGSSTFAEYYTVIDAIGYTDSGFNGDYFAQDNGLDAPGYDIELAYNHVTVDSLYPGVGAVLNDYHVKTVREIVKSFMDAAALDVKISFETGGKRTAYLEPTFVATNLDDAKATPGGWAEKNAGDDIWDYGADQPFAARPAKYWEDLRPFVREGDQPGVLVKATASDVDRAFLDKFDTFVIPGSAIKEIQGDAAAIEAVKGWVTDGGSLVLTDEALRYFDLAGVTSGAVGSENRYMGGIKMDLTHPLLAKVRGGVKQTYEPTPIGFETGANAAPNWFVDAGAYATLGGEVAGIECGTPQLSDPCTGNGVALGRVVSGSGQIQFIGALLPNPTEEFYHPYGLDHYATTYSGNQILRNMLGWDEVFDSPPIVITDSGEILQSANEPTEPAASAPGDDDAGKKDTPSVGLAALLLLLAGVLVARRRR